MPLFGDMSPYRRFDREEWARLRADTPLTLDEADLVRLRGLNDPINLEEVVKIYLPLSRLLSLYVEATQGLFHVTKRFLGVDEVMAELASRTGRTGLEEKAARPRD